METLFNYDRDRSEIPLAERCRPASLDDIIGHDQILSANAVLRRQISAGHLPSIILWGPPGVGKTTLAKAIANDSQARITGLSAVTSGVKDLKEVIRRAQTEQHLRHILFIDEIHRFNKAQQDGLLHAVEDGTIKLIGATTENPSFEIIPPLLSRCLVIKLNLLTANELRAIVNRAIETDTLLENLSINDSALNELIVLGGGDARRTLNILENCFYLVSAKNDPPQISRELIRTAAEQYHLYYDKKGDYHYDTISAFIKSLRGSDPDAALYYLAKMLNSGEDPVFICRRLIILAAEDVGNAEPYALSLTTAGLRAVQAIGMPEARIILSQITTYLASCPKSNAAYQAINAAESDVRHYPNLPVPQHLRNAPTSLMRELGYGSQYKYPHDFKGHFVSEKYRPPEVQEHVYYTPTSQGREKGLRDRLASIWPHRYKKAKSEKNQ